MPNRQQLRQQSAGFTLVELLVVISIMLILAVMTLGAISVLTDGDDVRAASRQIQSALEGARGRAAYAKESRGIRFVTRTGTNDDRRVVSSMIYVRPSPPAIEGEVRLQRRGTETHPTLPTIVCDAGSCTDRTPPYVYGTRWIQYYRLGLMRGVMRIKLPNTPTGTWYSVVAEDPYDDDGNPLTPAFTDATVKSIAESGGNSVPLRLRLLEPYQGPLVAPSSPVSEPDATDRMTYRLELAPSEVPNEVPMLLPKNVVLHLDRCSDTPDGPATALDRSKNLANRLPSVWKLFNTNPTYGFDYVSNLDIMFSPRGPVVGDSASAGIIHLYLSTLKDADQDHADWLANAATAPEYGIRPSDNYERGQSGYVTVYTRTGSISSHRVNDDLSDRFKFGEIGEVTGK